MSSYDIEMAMRKRLPACPHCGGLPSIFIHGDPEKESGDDDVGGYWVIECEGADGFSNLGMKHPDCDVLPQVEDTSAAGAELAWNAMVKSASTSIGG